jgi:hypothetical protein
MRQADCRTPRTAEINRRHRQDVAALAETILADTLYPELVDVFLS